MNHEVWVHGYLKATRKGEDAGKAKTGYGWVCSCGHAQVDGLKRQRADSDAYTHLVTQHQSTTVPHLVDNQTKARAAAEAHRQAMRQPS